jgi:hypothetical protein
MQLKLRAELFSTLVFLLSLALSVARFWYPAAVLELVFRQAF